MKIVYVEVKASDELPKVPGYYNVRSIHDPYGRFTQAEYEEGVSDSGWKLSYVWLKKIELPTEEEGQEKEELLQSLIKEVEGVMVCEGVRFGYFGLSNEEAVNMEVLFDKYKKL